MPGNSFGSVFRISTFGESHGNGLGVVIDGCPAGLEISLDKIQSALDKRRPGADINGIKSAAVTNRNEPDCAEILSGVFKGKSEGTPIAIIIKNTSQISKHYGNLENTFRPGHADFCYDAKYGFRDFRGGGRSSGRETAARVAAGAIAAIFLEKYKIRVTAYTLRACGIDCSKISFDEISQNSMRAPDNEAALKMNEAVEELRRKGDSGGGIIECVAEGVPAGLGEPVFDKLEAELAKAVMSVGAVKGIEFGAGFKAADLWGSENNDNCHVENGNVVFDSNNSGGILGGISTGNKIIFRAAVKPVPSIFIKQQTVCKNENGYDDCELEIEGRHDICLCPRIVPVIEAMVNIVLTDMILRNRASHV